MLPELSLIEQLREFETALVAEAMGALGCEDAESHYMGNSVQLLTQLSEPLVGTALTILADTSTPGNSSDTQAFWDLCRNCLETKIPSVAVVKATGARFEHECIVGDGMAKMLKSCGCAGLITDGGARDISQINKCGFTVFGSGKVANHTPYKMKITNEPVNIAGLSIQNDCLIHADADGVITIPSSYHAGIVQASILCREFETRVHCFWRRTDKTIEEKMEFVAQQAKLRSELCQPYVLHAEKAVKTNL